VTTTLGLIRGNTIRARHLALLDRLLMGGAAEILVYGNAVQLAPET